MNARISIERPRAPSCTLYGNGDRNAEEMASRNETERKIVQVAFDFIDERGIEAFSMRAIAKELNMGTMSVYRYFDSKDALLDAVRTKLRTLYDNKPVPGERWDDTLRRTTGSIRSVALAHPNVWTKQSGYQTSAQPHTRRVYQLHKDQGMPIEVYRPLWCALEAYLIGFIGQEISTRNTVFEPLDPNDPDFDWLMIAETAYSDETFGNGLELIIRGVRDTAPGECEWRTPEDPSEWSWGKQEA